MRELVTTELFVYDNYHGVHKLTPKADALEIMYGASLFEHPERINTRRLPEDTKSFPVCRIAPEGVRLDYILRWIESPTLSTFPLSDSVRIG